MFSHIHEMQRADLLTLLAIIIALSAYLATVRLFAIDRLTQLAGDLQKRKKVHRNLRLLFVADAPMTVSAVFLGIYILYSNAPSCFLPTSIYLFTFAGLMLLIYHIYAWIKSFSRVT